MVGRMPSHQLVTGVLNHLFHIADRKMPTNIIVARIVALVFGGAAIIICFVTMGKFREYCADMKAIAGSKKCLVNMALASVMSLLAQVAPGWIYGLSEDPQHDTVIISVLAWAMAVGVLMFPLQSMADYRRFISEYGKEEK